MHVHRRRNNLAAVIAAFLGLFLRLSKCVYVLSIREHCTAVESAELYFQLLWHTASLKGEAAEPTQLDFCAACMYKCTSQATVPLKHSSPPPPIRYPCRCRLLRGRTKLMRSFFGTCG